MTAEPVTPALITTDDLKRLVYIHLGEDGTEALEVYGLDREKEGRGSALLACSLLVALGFALWPWVKALWQILVKAVWG